MSDLKAVAQQALTILEAWKHKGMWGDWDGVTDTLRAALAEPPTDWEAVAADQAMTIALMKAEPVQEPVAWIQPNHLQKARRAPFLCRVEPTKRMVDFVALYTAPPQRKPLTEEKIRNAINTFKAAENLMGVNHIDVARAIERAHGIGDRT